MLDAATVDAVLLDVGGVLFLPSHAHVSRALERVAVSATPAQIDRAHYVGLTALDSFVEGDREIWAKYHRAYAEACDVPPERVDEAVDALLSEFTAAAVWSRAIPGAREALGALCELEPRPALAIVSNSDGTVAAKLREESLCQVGHGPGAVVDAIVDSTVVGVAKPDPKIFQLALDALGVPASRAVHVGDTPGADVAGALAAGVTPILVDPYGLHPEVDCTRVRSLAEVVELLRR